MIRAHADEAVGAAAPLQPSLVESLLSPAEGTPDLTPVEL
jgi:hypothetical protein